jgi:hypothetical protein
MVHGLCTRSTYDHLISAMAFASSTAFCCRPGLECLQWSGKLKLSRHRFIGLKLLLKDLLSIEPRYFLPPTRHWALDCCFQSAIISSATPIHGDSRVFNLVGGPTGHKTFKSVPRLLINAPQSRTQLRSPLNRHTGRCRCQLRALSSALFEYHALRHVLSVAAYFTRALLTRLALFDVTS